MTSVLSRALPQPTNWQDFESLCFDLYARLWKTNDIEMHGRRGQAQAGVDVYGTDRVEQKFVGVQCKGKEEGYGAALTKAELRKEVKKAKTFKPPIDVFIVATTAMNDTEAQSLAREISKEHAKQGLFEVRVQGWLTLRQRITDYPELLVKHFRDFAPYDIVPHFVAGVTVTEREGSQTRALILQQTEILASLQRGDAGDPLQLKIDEAIKLVEEGSPRAALRVYERLWKEEAAAASKRNRYRLKANIALVNLFLGNREIAIYECRSAYAEDPEWPAARAILATALVLEGELQQAFDMACQVLTEDPTAHQAVAVLVDAAPAELTAADIKELIPEDLRNHVDALLGLSMYAHKQGDYTASESYARRALDIRQDDWRPLATHAGALLGPIAEIDGIGFTRNVPPELQSRFDQAIDLFREAWSMLVIRDDAIRGAYVAANLITSLDVAGLSDEATLILGQALRIAPNYVPLLRRHARNMAEADDWPAAARAIESIPQDDLEPADRLVRLHALIRTGEAAHARVEARKLQETSDDQHFIGLAGAMRLEAAASLGVLKDELDDLLKDWPNSIILRSVAIGLLPDGDPRTAVLVGELDQLVADIHDPRDRFHAAEALYRAKAFNRAADLYEGLHGTSQDHPALRRRLEALYFADRRADARQLFDSLADNLKIQADYADLGVAIYERSGLLKEAREMLERRLTDAENLAKRLQWVALVDRLGDGAAAIKWLKAVSSGQQGRPGDLMALALAIDGHLGGIGSLPVAYRALRGGFGDPQIHLSYTFGLFLMGKVGHGRIETPLIVAPDVAVILVEKDGNRRLTRIIETEPNPQIERYEIDPSHVLAQRLLGLRLGDEIELENVGFEPTHYVVAELQNKYLYAHFRSLSQFETMFPENTAFGSFSVDQTKGEEQFKPILDGAKRNHAFTEKLFEIYRSGSMPLALLAKYWGKSPLEVWELIRHQPGGQFHTAFGVAPEFSEANRTLAVNRRVVVDAVTLYGLVQLGIANRLKAAFEDVGVVRTTLDLLRADLMEWQGKKGRQQGSFGWDGQRYRMAELTHEMIDQHLTNVQATLDFAETLTLVPAETRIGIIDEAKDIFENVHPAFLDSVLAAQGDGRVFLCDDCLLRNLAAEAAGIPSVWSQAAARFSFEKRIISSESYFEITGALVDAGYAFTMIGHLDFLYELRRTIWAVSPRAKKFITLLALPSVDPESLRNVLTGLMILGWQNAPSETAYRIVFGRLFRALKDARPDIVVAKLAQDVFNQATAAVRAKAQKTLFIDRLKRSTFLTPVLEIVLSIEQVVRRDIDRIANAISKSIAGLD
jgi:tetratricopeptide (TPR) repeat protein